MRANAAFCERRHASAAAPGLGGVTNHGQGLLESQLPAPEIAAKQLRSSDSLAELPVPMLDPGSVPLLQLGRLDGELVIVLPGAGTFPHQQLPVLLGELAHQKSVPFGSTAPVGDTPIVVP